jgi:hypothetical protein
MKEDVRSLRGFRPDRKYHRTISPRKVRTAEQLPPKDIVIRLAEKIIRGNK